jgi:hypothetical protein
MKGGVYVVVDKNANDGITRPASSGGIINKDENENNYISWVIKNGTSNDYTVPWLSSDLTYIPFIYHVNSSGTNDGRLVFSTWQTSSDNSTPIGVTGKPNGVANMNDSHGFDNSLSCADRFWWIKFENYGTKPTASLTFGYNDPSDIAAPNTFTKSDLQAQYWSTSSSQWASPPSGDGTSGNYVNGVTAQIFDAPWVLSSKKSPLPIELLSFNAKIRDTVVDIFWTTVSEINSDYFKIERTTDFNEINEIATVEAAGMSNTIIDYYTIDEYPLTGISYYRLKEVDYDGSLTYSDWVEIEYNPVEISSSVNLVSIFPNPANDQINIIFNTSETGNTYISVFDVQGKLLKTASPAVSNAGNTIITLDIYDLPSGMYIIRITNGNTFSAGRFIKSK